MSRSVKFTKHAKLRALERDVNSEDAEFVINSPIETIFDPERQNYKSFSLVNHPLTKGPAYLMVVHGKFNTRVTIISVMWQTRGGLRKNGFNKV
ncbi:MAG: DUF4258 domain-containing protein [Thaumarchaeota archaeon]|nr:DUF4258 domain-containing protein [Nitrososphaerota archaeon]